MPYPAKISTAEVRETALRLLEAQGIEAVSMRSLAEVLGVRASSLYRHIAHREALLTLLSEDAASQLREALVAAASRQAGRPALEAVALVFVTFARTCTPCFIHRARRRSVQARGSGCGSSFWPRSASPAASPTTPPEPWLCGPFYTASRSWSVPACTG